MKLRPSIRFAVVLCSLLLVSLVFLHVHRRTPSTASLPSNQQELAFRDMVPAASRLDKLARQFDVNHDQELSPQEQEAMVAYVTKSFGTQWGDRLKRFFRVADANNDGAIDLQEWTRAVAKVTRLAKTRPSPTKPQTFQVAMRDGVHLATDVYFPEGDGPFPIVFSRTPYGRGKATEGAADFAAAGYVAIVQDMRGRFDSEGENLPFIGCG